MRIENKFTAKAQRTQRKESIIRRDTVHRVPQRKEQKTMNVGEKITRTDRFETCLYKGSEIIRKWIFSAKTHDDAVFYLDEFGNEIDYSDAVPFIGNNHDAVLEAERRANLWEDGKNGLLAEITYESQGIL